MVARGSETEAMTSRTNESTVTFQHQFNLSPLDGPQPAGTYRLVVVDDEIPGLSFVAYRRSSTMLHVPALTAGTGKTQVFPVDSEELATAISADAERSALGKAGRNSVK